MNIIMNMVKNKKIILVIMICLVVTLLASGTYAYLNWQTGNEQKTAVVFTAESEFSCAVDGGGNITEEDVDIIPTTCTSSHAIKTTVQVTPTIIGTDMVVDMDLWIKINSIDSGLTSGYDFRYALTTSSTSCSSGVISSGSFKGTSDGDTIKILNKNYGATITETYYLYIWLQDSPEMDSSTMNQSFELTLGGECINIDKSSYDTAYAVYSADDSSLRFYRTNEEIVEGDTYNNLTATAVYTGIESSSYTSVSSVPWYEYRESITDVVVEDIIFPIDTGYWFKEFKNCASMDLTKLNTSSVTNMSSMFFNAGYNLENFTIVGLDNWNVSNVTNMDYMFDEAGGNATTFDIGDLSDWNVSSVTSMNGLFNQCGINDTTWSVGDLSNWNVSNVTSMSYMFCRAGSSATTFNIGDLSDWNVSNVTSMENMFSDAGYDSTTFNIEGLSNWNVSNVTNMEYMFSNAGRNATTWSIGNLSNWDVSNVTNMMSMFYFAGDSATTFNIGDLSDWDVSNVTSMENMFYRAGYSATTFNIGNISSWDTSGVTYMRNMFGYAGYTATNWSLDLSGWNVNLVTAYSGFNTGVTSKVTAPTWVN